MTLARLRGWLRRNVLCWHPSWRGQMAGRLLPYPNRYCTRCGRTEKAAPAEAQELQAAAKWPRCRPYKRRTPEELESAMRVALDTSGQVP